MVEIGKINKLTVKAIGPKEVTFIADDDEEIKVPAEEFKEMPQEGDVVKIFLYKDANRKTIGSAKFPYAIAGEFEFLSVTQVSSAGALLDWGLKRKLFLPSKEQTSKIALGDTYLVHVFYDHKTEHRQHACGRFPRLGPTSLRDERRGGDFSRKGNGLGLQSDCGRRLLGIDLP